MDFFKDNFWLLGGCVASVVFGFALAKLAGLVINEYSKEIDLTLPPSVYSIFEPISWIRWIMLFKKDTMKALTVAKQSKGNTFRINLIFKDLFITYEPNLVKKYVSKEWERYLDFYQPTTTNMKQLISLSDSVIPYKRHINSVLMNRDEIESWMVEQCYQECNEFFNSMLEDNNHKNNDINITNQFEHLLFRCLLKCLVGDSKYMLKNSSNFQQNLLFLLNNFNNMFVKNLPPWWPVGIRKQYTDTHKWFSDTINQAYMELQHQMVDSSTDNSSKGLSYLQHLVLNPLRGREDDIRHVFAMLYGATVNTIPSILLAIITLHKEENSKFLKKLIKYVDEFGNVNDKNIKQLWEYDELDRVLNEILRLYPVRIITRVTKSCIKLDGTPYTVPKNGWFIMSPYLIHRDEKNYTNCNDFIPDRWIDDQFVRSMKRQGKYMNFGFGSHSCMGRRFATMLFKTFFISFLKNYKLSLNNNNCYDVIYRSKKRGFSNDIYGKVLNR